MGPVSIFKLKRSFMENKRCFKGVLGCFIVVCDSFRGFQKGFTKISEVSGILSYPGSL